MKAYYNEFDPFAAEWLRNLIAAGHLPPGDVDERSIIDVKADDLRGYGQVHFFAGIGGWAHALHLAGWGDRPVWTGSCPCQPFSLAGRQAGVADERHLWPTWFNLIRECRPGVVFGEQVASAVGHGWLDVIYADMEGEGYACGAVILGAHSLGAPHIRQRLFFVAHDGGQRREGAGFHTRGGLTAHRIRQASVAGDASTPSPVADADGRDARAEGVQRSGQYGQQPEDGGTSRLEQSTGEQMGVPGRAWIAGSAPWADCDWLPCTDGKARPVEPGTFPLAHGIPGRVGRLRAYGNAVVPQVAAALIAAYMEVEG